MVAGVTKREIRQHCYTTHDTFGGGDGGEEGKEEERECA